MDVCSPQPRRLAHCTAAVALSLALAALAQLALAPAARAASARASALLSMRFRPVAGDRGTSVVVRLARSRTAADGAAVGSDPHMVEVVVPSSLGAAAVTRLERRDDVRYAEAGVTRHFMVAPNDPLFSTQWNLAAIRWNETMVGAPAAKIALIDSGVDASHPEIAPSHTDGSARLAGFFDGATGGSSPVDTVGHGTMTTSVIAATTGNGVGITGIADAAPVIVGKIDQGGVPALADELRAVDWAIANGARVINMSFGSSQFSQAEADAIARAVAANVLVVAAAGNDGCAATGGSNAPQYPASLPDVIAVASVAQGDVPSCFSEHGPNVDIAAPGEHIPVAKPSAIAPAGQLFDSVDGTSFSAPTVAAAAALVRGLRPDLDQAAVRDVLLQSARDVGTPGPDEFTGTGVLDVAAALTFARTATNSPKRTNVAGALLPPSFRTYPALPRTLQLIRAQLRARFGALVARKATLRCVALTAARHRCVTTLGTARLRYVGITNLWYTRDSAGLSWSARFVGTRLLVGCTPVASHRCSSRQAWWL